MLKTKGSVNSKPTKGKSFKAAVFDGGWLYRTSSFISSNALPIFYALDVQGQVKGNIPDKKTQRNTCVFHRKGIAKHCTIENE